MPAGDAWLHELKLDGYRLQMKKARREVLVFTRRGAEGTERLAGFAEAFVTLACRSAVLDGELVLPEKPSLLTSADCTAPWRRLVTMNWCSSRSISLHRDGQDLRASSGAVILIFATPSALRPRRVRQVLPSGGECRLSVGLATVARGDVDFGKQTFVGSP